MSHSCPPPSPQLQQPDHMSLPHRGCFAFFHSARGQTDGFIWGQVSLPDPLFHGQRVGGGRVSLYNYSCRGQILWAIGKSERDRDQLSKTDTRKMATAESVVCSLKRNGHHLSLIWWLVSVRLIQVSALGLPSLNWAIKLNPWLLLKVPVRGSYIKVTSAFTTKW